MNNGGDARARRDWLADALRYGALAGLSLFSGVMLVRSVRAKGDGGCDFAAQCRGCSRLADCGRAEAARFQQQG